MSNTPITDANLWVGINGCFKTKNTGGKGYVPELIARELETKLVVANDRINRLEDIINRAHLAFFSDSSDRKVSIAMHRILDEEVRKEANP